VAQTYSNINGLFKVRYGRWIEPLPDEHTLADFGDFIPAESRPGSGYAFPVLTAIEHGQTADNTNNAFTLNPAVDSNVKQAQLDGSTILLQSVVSYDTIYKSLNGSGQGNQGGAFKTALDQAVQAMLMGAGLYRELALAYGPGSGATLLSNIGVINSNVSATNVSVNTTISLTQASWIPGLWILAQNMLIDIYNSAGTTLQSNGIKIVGRPDPAKAQLTIIAQSPQNTTGPTFSPVAGNVIVPYGWFGKSCVGLEGIYNNSGLLFGIDASQVAPWRANVFSAGFAALTRAKVMSFAAIVSINGAKNGGRLFVSAPTFAALAEEFNSVMTPSQSGISAVSTYDGNNNKRDKEIGSSSLAYVTAAGVIEVVVYQYAKQGQALFIANDNFRRVGSTDLTMRPIGGGAEAFFTHLTTQSGAQMKIFSNQAPVFEIPYRNFLVNNIVNTGYDVPPV
jgi:hypothetical protein